MRIVLLTYGGYIVMWESKVLSVVRIWAQSSLIEEPYHLLLSDVDRLFFVNSISNIPVDRSIF